MMKYSTAGFQNPMASSYKTQLEMIGATTLRFKLYDVLWGVSGTPADNAMVADIIRITAGGTGTSVTPAALDPADPAATVACEEDSTGEPTTTGVALFEVPMNQRATMRWAAVPGSELVCAAVANEGFALRAKIGTYTGVAEVTAFHEE